MVYRGFLGTYAQGEEGFLWRFWLDGETGALSGAAPALRAADCKYLSLEGGVLALPLRRGGRTGLLLAAADGTEVLGAAFGGGAETACHVLQADGRIFTANYHDGGLRIYRSTAAGPVPERTLATGAGSGCHQALLDGGLLLAPCLEQDLVRVFDGDCGWAQRDPIVFPPGSGPRHGWFDRAHRRLFFVTERSCELFCFSARAGTYAPEWRVPLPGGGAAALRASPDERFLYVSVRRGNLLCVLRADEPALLQQTDCGGDHPRDLALSPGGGFVLAVNRCPGSAVSFRRDPETGLILEKCSEISVPQAVSAVFEV